MVTHLIYFIMKLSLSHMETLTGVVSQSSGAQLSEDVRAEFACTVHCTLPQTFIFLPCSCVIYCSRGADEAVHFPHISRLGKSEMEQRSKYFILH